MPNSVLHTTNGFAYHLVFLSYHNLVWEYDTLYFLIVVKSAFVNLKENSRHNILFELTFIILGEDVM
jgi:hypothetical protein